MNTYIFWDFNDCAIVRAKTMNRALQLMHEHHLMALAVDAPRIIKPTDTKPGLIFHLTGD